MNIQKGDFIKHQAAMDIAFRVWKVTSNVDSIKISGFWWNQGQSDRSWCVDNTYIHSFDINKRHLQNWLVLQSGEELEEVQLDYSIRGKSWLPVK